MSINLQEEWRPVVGYEGYYEVSNLGNVRSVDRVIKANNGKRLAKSITLKQTKDKDGYFKVNLSKEQKSKYTVVHKLVAIAFIGKCPGKQGSSAIDPLLARSFQDNSCISTKAQQNKCSLPPIHEELHTLKTYCIALHQSLQTV